ncbi:MAG: phosphate ABC transporter permease PstA [Candidatus Oxydemutatoraceae bacterium WSBS_2016_MAG_OTU14]
MNSTEKRLHKRLAKDRYLRYCGIASIALALCFLAMILTSIIGSGYTVFQQAKISLTLDLTTLSFDPQQPRKTNFSALLDKALREEFPQATTRQSKRALKQLISKNASYTLQDDLIAHPEWLGTNRQYWVIADSNVDLYMKGKIDKHTAETHRQLSDQQIDWIETLRANKQIEFYFNKTFFSSGDSRNPEQSGMLAALKGSLYLMLITFFLSFPIGIGAAIYLEEFAPKNRWTDLIEVNINNLAAVPSIIFGLLGLAIFINTFGFPRSSPLVGGIVLSLMTLPTIIIASRAAIKAVPRSVCEGAYALGATHIQVIMHHILPLAMPGMLTGSIIGMAQALGESAPLMLIGMVAFIVDIPDSMTTSATALPVQIFSWSKLPEQGFVERAAGAIIVLLAILFVINAFAIYLRKRLEKRW